MHQEHNVPWNLVAANLSFVRENGPSRRTDLFPKRRSTQSKELGHFARILARTISDFSETERAKFPKSFDEPPPPLLSGKLFSDELRDRHSEFLNQDNQLVENWISRAATEDAYSYSTSHGDLADVVKVLVIENTLQPLLMLANHPMVPLQRLHHLSWGHHFGFSRVAEAALHAYLFFNVVAATDTLRGGEYREMTSFSRLLTHVTASMDYDAQQLPHRAFFFGLRHGQSISSIDIHSDPVKLHTYLKDLFRLLYRYDMVVRECGSDPRWEHEIAGWFGHMWSVKTEYIETERGWMTQFT